MIFAQDANNIAVTGRGTLDGLAKYEFVEMRGIDPEIATEIEIARKAGVDMGRYYRTGMQTYMFILNNCTNILVQIFMTPEDAIDKRSSHALLIEDVRGLIIKDMTIRWDEENPEKNWQSALVLKNVSDFEIRSFSGRQGLVSGPSPAILLENISEGLIAGSKAEAGCNTFIRVNKAVYYQESIITADFYSEIM